MSTRRRKLPLKIRAYYDFAASTPNGMNGADPVLSAAYLVGSAERWCSGDKDTSHIPIFLAWRWGEVQEMLAAVAGGKPL